MTADAGTPLGLQVDAATQVSALWLTPSQPGAVLVLAHGAGAGMRHRWLVEAAAQLAQRGVATLRYQFPYMERGAKRTDPPSICHATVRAAVTLARQMCPAPLFAGGRSFGGRMTSQAQAESPLPGVRGLAFLGFPLHPAGKPSTDRAAHLFQVRIPQLFLQGTRDELAQLGLLEPLIAQLNMATLKLSEGADHSFHVPARSGRTDAIVLSGLIDCLADWINLHCGVPAS